MLAGGSAGAICWFDGGHSDSMDPASFKEAMMVGASPGAQMAGEGAAESTEGGGADAEAAQMIPKASWEYSQ